MRLEEHIRYACSAWADIHPNRANVLDHLFCVIGNGYEWKDGQLVDGTFVFPRTTCSQAIQKVRKQQREQAKLYRKTPMAFLYKDCRYSIPRDIATRVKKTAGYNHWYPLCQYSKMVTFPEDIRLSWLNGIIETARLIVATPVWGQSQGEIRQAEQTIQLAKQSLDRALTLRARRFPRYRRTA